jgi:hypothetical protein
MIMRNKIMMVRNSNRLEDIKGLNYTALHCTNLGKFNDEIGVCGRVEGRCVRPQQNDISFHRIQ